MSATFADAVRHAPAALAGGSALRWLRRAPRARARIVCFPFAGAGPSAFRDWLAHVPDDVDLVGVVYPGRESRATEPLQTRLQALVDALQPELGVLAELPCAWFGHSMGGYVAFECARAASARGRGPEHVFVSAAGAPHLPEPAPIHALPPRDFLRAIVRLGGIPPEVLREPELVAYALPVLRADLTACETHRFDAGRASPFPLTVFGGDRDARIDVARLEAWRSLAGEAFALRMFAGDHFYLRAHAATVVAAVVAALREAR